MSTSSSERLALSATRDADHRQPQIRVAFVPAGHVYVRHLAPLGETSVTRLPDPRPSSSALPGQWWPPAMLEPGWIEEHADDFDVFHLHFGFDALTPDHLSAVVANLRRAAKPFIYTVHDLRNPHHDQADDHDAALDVLIPGADALITLTDGAADEIRRRWDVEAHVLPHPHVVELNRIRPRPQRDGDFVVGLHAKSLRANVRPLEVLRELLPLQHELPGLRLRFDVHRDVFDSAGRNHHPELAAVTSAAARAGDLDLRVHDYFSDDELWSYLESLDLSVLPYRFGTHSGWVEACYDLGTAVLAPDCGFYAQQRPMLSYQHDETRLDGESLRAAVRRAYAERPLWQATRAERMRERSAVAAAHVEIYTSVTR